MPPANAWNLFVKFGEAFEIIPRMLAETSGQDATNLVSQLYTAHQNGEPKAGVDLASGLADKVVGLTRDAAIHIAAARKNETNKRLWK